MTNRRLIVIMLAGVLSALPCTQSSAQEGYTGLVCRGVEESGRLYIGQPGFGPHLVSLFVTGANPLSATQTLPEHVAWVNDPLHSYVADGTGAMVIWAHPSDGQFDGIMALEGLTGIEVNYAGDALAREALWDRVLTACANEGRPFLWGFGDDDTHSSERANLSWFAARLPEFSELALKHALRSGSFYISNGPLIDDIQVEGDAISLALPQEAEVLWLRAGQHLSKDDPGPINVTTEAGAGNCLRREEGVTQARFSLADAGVPAGELKFIRAVVRTDPTHVAQTQPFRVSADGAIANPYADAGEWVRGQSHNHIDPGPRNRTGIIRYRLDYQEFGQLASFSTDYSYWESPYQWHPDDGTPQIEAIRPDRVPQGEPVEVTVSGVNFAPGAEAMIAGRTLATEAAGEDLTVLVPADLPAGIHDLTVTNPDGFRDTVAQGFTVQEPGATSHGWQHWTPADGLPYDRAIAVAAAGDDIYVATIGGVGRWHDGAWQTEGLPSSSTYHAVVGPDGRPWLSGSGGIFSMDPDGTWTTHKVGQGEKLTPQTSMERWGRLGFDAEGRLWAGNRWGRGIGVRHPDGTWERITTTAGGAPSNSPSAPACAADGTLWLGFANGLYRRIGGEWQPVQPPDELADCRFMIVLTPSADGGMWAAVTGNPGSGGVIRFDADGNAVETLTPQNSPLPSTRVRDILVTSTGDVWFASDMGVARLGADGKWQSVTSLTTGLGCNIVLGLAEASDGSIWFATARGVSRYTP